MATLRIIPVDATAKAALGGDCTAREWLGTKSGSPETVIAKAKSATITLKLAVGGTVTSPVWSDEYTLTISDSQVLAADLQSAINANLKKNGCNIVLVNCQAVSSGDEDFYVYANGGYQNFLPLF